MIAFRNRGPVGCQHVGLVAASVESMTHLDGLSIKTKALLLIGQEILNVLALISLELDDLTHLGVCDYGAIAGELLLNDLEDLLLVKLLGQTLHGGQCLASIALCIVLARVLRKVGGDRGSASWVESRRILGG